MSEAPVNEQHHEPAQPERAHCVPPGRRFADEDRAWSQLYAAVLQGQTSTSAEVVKALDADPKAKQLRLALYMHAKTTLHKHKAVEARNQRIAAFLRLDLVTLVLGPFRLLHSLRRSVAGVAVEMLPPANREPAKARASALKNDPSFVDAKQRFDAGAEGSRTAVAAEESRGPKAA